MHARLSLWLRALLIVQAGAAGTIAACSSDGVGADACRQIESVRCERAPACGLNLSMPPSATADLVEGCKRYYNDACKRGTVAKRDPDVNELSACVAALRIGDCTGVKAPETITSCSFLIPEGDAGVPDSAAPAPADAAPADAAVDALPLTDANGIRP
jgi:hypothetical protein